MGHREISTVVGVSTTTALVQKIIQNSVTASRQVVWGKMIDTSCIDLENKIELTGESKTPGQAYRSSRQWLSSRGNGTAANGKLPNGVRLRIKKAGLCTE